MYRKIYSHANSIRVMMMMMMMMNHNGITSGRNITIYNIFNQTSFSLIKLGTSVRA